MTQQTRNPEIQDIQKRSQTEEYKTIARNSEALEKIKTKLNQVDKLNEQEISEIKTQLESIEVDINSLLDSMEAETKTEYNDEISNLKWLRVSVENLLQTKTKQELDKLEQEVGLWEKTKEWFKNVFSVEWWKENPGTNALRVWWTVVGVWWLSKLWKWVKSLFGWWKEKEKKEEEKEEEKGFWNSRFWETIKRAGLGIWGYFWFQWIKDWITGKTKTDDTRESQIDKFETNKNREKYNSLWTNINDFYKNLYSLENEIGYEEENKLWSIVNTEWKNPEKFDGLVPFCMDSQYESVDDMITENAIESTGENWIDRVYSKLVWATQATIKKAVWPFLRNLKSRADFNQDWNKTYEEFLKHDPEARKKELEVFFRQQIKTTTFLVDRRNMLEAKIAKDVIKMWKYQEWENVVKRPNNKEDQTDLLEDVLSDSDFRERYIEKHTDYISYNSWSLINANQILEKEWLLDDKISSPLQEIVADLDEESRDILAYQELDDWTSITVLDQIAQDVISKSLSEDSQKKLNKLEEDLLEDMNWEEWFMQRNFDYLTYALNMDDHTKQTLIENWFGDLLNNYEKWLNAAFDEFRKNPTKENLAKIKKITAKQLAFKKEITTSIYTIQSCITNNRSWSTILSKTLNVFTNLSTWFSEITQGDVLEWYAKAAPWLFISWWILYVVWRSWKQTILWRFSRFTWKIAMRAGWAPVVWAYKLWKYTLFSWKYRSSKIKTLHKIWKEDQAKRLLQYAVSEWKINKNRILSLWSELFWISTWTDETKYVDILKKFFWNNVNQARSNSFLKYYKNKKLRKLFVNFKWNTSGLNRRQKYITQTNSKKTYSLNIWALDQIWEIDDVITKNQGKNFGRLLDKSLKQVGELWELSRIRNLSINKEMITKINNLDSNDFSKLLKYLKSDDLVSVLDDIHNLYSADEIVSKLTMKRKQTRIIKEILNKNFSDIKANKLSALWSLVQTDFDIVSGKLKWSSSINRAYYKRQMDLLWSFTDKIPEMKPSHINAFNTLNSKWFSPLQIVRLQQFMESPLTSSDDAFKALKTAISEWDFNNVIKHLDDIWKRELTVWSNVLDAAWNKIAPEINKMIPEAQDLLDELKRIKNAFSGSDELLETSFKSLKWFIRILTKVT